MAANREQAVSLATKCLISAACAGRLADYVSSIIETVFVSVSSCHYGYYIYKSIEYMVLHDGSLSTTSCCLFIHISFLTQRQTVTASDVSALPSVANFALLLRARRTPISSIRIVASTVTS